MQTESRAGGLPLIAMTRRGRAACVRRKNYGGPARSAGRFRRGGFLRHGDEAAAELLRAVVPYSNVGLAQVLPSENAECVCRALKQVFEYIAGSPPASCSTTPPASGRKICGGVRTTETFAAHYGFEFGFCNPNSGHEKGNVERKVYFIRQNLFVPVPRLARVESRNSSWADARQARLRRPGRACARTGPSARTAPRWRIARKAVRGGPVRRF